MAPPVRKGYPVGVTPRAYPSGTVGRGTLVISPDYQRVLEQKALSGQQFLTPEQLRSVTGGGTLSASDSPIAATTPVLRGTRVGSGTQTVPLTADALNPFLGGALKGKGQMVIDTANKYGVDPRLVGSIILAESGGGTSHVAQTKNNPMGIFDSRANTSRTFDTVENGIDFGVRNLANNYLAQGRTTPESIGAKWAPPGAANDPNQTNASWPGMVRAGIAKLGGQGGNIQNTTATGQQVATGDQTSDTGQGPIYIAPVDRSTLKPITGMGELSTADEMAHAKARTEDWLNVLAQAGVAPTQKDYQAHLDSFYNEVHQLNKPEPGQQFVNPDALTQTSPSLLTNLPRDSKTGAIQMPTGNQSWTQDQLQSLATYNTNQWVKSLASQGIKVTNDQYRQEQLNQYNGASSMNIGLRPTAMSSADVDAMNSLHQGYRQLTNLGALYTQADKAGSFDKIRPILTAGALIPHFGEGAEKVLTNINATPEYKAFDAYRNEIMGNITRGYGGEGSGVLTEQKVNITKNWFPNEFDTPTTAQTKILDAQAEGLQAERDKLRLFTGAHQDTTEATKQYQEDLADFQARVDALRAAGNTSAISSMVNSFYPGTTTATQTPPQAAANAELEKKLLEKQTGVTPAPAPASQQQDIPVAKVTPESDTGAQTTVPTNPQAQAVNYTGGDILPPQAAAPPMTTDPRFFDTTTQQSLPPAQPQPSVPYDQSQDQDQNQKPNQYLGGY